MRILRANPPRNGFDGRNGEVTGWSSQSPDLIPPKCGEGIGSGAVHASKTSNILRMNEFCIEKWSKVKAR